MITRLGPPLVCLALAAGCGNGAAASREVLQPRATSPATCAQATLDYGKLRDASASVVSVVSSSAGQIAAWQEQNGIGAVGIPTSVFRSLPAVTPVEYCVFQGTFPLLHRPADAPERSFQYLVVLTPLGQDPQEFEITNDLPPLPG